MFKDNYIEKSKNNVKSLWFDGIISPLEAGAKGCLEGINFMQDQNFTHVIIEFDCLAVV